MARMLSAEHRDDRFSRDALEFRSMASLRDSALAGLMRRWHRRWGPHDAAKFVAAGVENKTLSVFSSAPPSRRRISLAISCSVILHAVVIASVPRWHGEGRIQPAAV